jgi:hypothetical protein
VGGAILSFPRERQNGMSAKITGTVKFRLNPARPPKLTKKARKRLAAQPDEDIDFSDIPPTYGVAWARPGLPEPAESKHHITARQREPRKARLKADG